MKKNKNFFSCSLILVLLSAPLFAEVSEDTAKANAKILQLLPFDNKEDFEEASRGFIGDLPEDGIIKNAKGEVIWDLKAYDFLGKEISSAPKSVNPSLWRQAQLMKKTGLFKVVDRIYQVRGADLSNMTIIEGESGIIIVDPLLSKETAKAAIELYYTHRPKKEIKAVLYTHSHGDHFGGVKGVISQEEVDAGKVKVIAPYGFTSAALDENVMAGNAMTRRATYMYGTLIPPGINGQVSAGLGLTTSRGEMTLILPTDFVEKTGQEMMIDGVKFVFLMAPGSEAPAEMLFFLPQFKALGVAEDATHTMHNLYTLRGAKIRDARAWASYLNQAIDLFGAQTEVVFAQHHWPKWGQERIIDYLEKQRDMFKYIHDQSLRLANQGFTRTEVGEMIRMPDSLAKEWYNRGYYGSLNHNAKSVYAFYLGWFNGNPATLHELPETEKAKKYVEYMGGTEAILAKARQDFKQGNYRWTAEVLNHLVYANPSNQEVKNFLADTLEQLGFQSENGTWRNFYLTGAQELRKGVQPRSVVSSANPDMIAAMPIEDFFDYLSIRLDGLKAAEFPMTANFYFTDTNRRYFLEIKNGVLHYTPQKTDPKADFTLSLTRKEFDAFVLGAKKIDQLTHQLKGNPEKFKTFFSLFDHFNRWFNIVEPQVSTSSEVNKETVVEVSAITTLFPSTSKMCNIVLLERGRDSTI